MTVTRVGTETDADNSAGGSSFSFSHTVPAGASLLLLAVFATGDVDVTVTPTWDGDDFTLINDSGPEIQGMQRIHVYGFVSPAAKTATIAGTTDGFGYLGVEAVNYAGGETASVAAAVNHLSDDVNSTNEISTVHASAGNAGNALIAMGSWRGGDTGPSTVDNSFNEIYDRATGGSTTNDTAHTMSELLDAAPSAVSITMTLSDQCTGTFIELVAATGVPVITDVNTTEEWNDGDTGLVITGTGFL